jgi:hypothetical protein
MEKEEKVRMRGIMQKRSPFQIPRIFELISLSFYNFSKAAPALIKIVSIKNANATVNSPEILYIRFCPNPYLSNKVFPLIDSLSVEENKRSRIKLKKSALELKMF